MRMIVEHVFVRMAPPGADWCQSIGLKRATQHNHLGNLVRNMEPPCLLGSLRRGEAPRKLDA